MCFDVFMIIEYGCCSYEVELEVWEKLEVVVILLVFDEFFLNFGMLFLEYDFQEDYLRELKIEV